MPTINDYKKKALVAYLGRNSDINTLEYWWLRGLVFPYVGANQDMWNRYLRNLGYTSGSLPDRWNKWLTSLGLTGSLNQKWFKYWRNFDWFMNQENNDDLIWGMDANEKRAFLPAYGSELVTNGTFDTDLSGWTELSTAPSVMVWSGGQAVQQTDGANPIRLSQGISVERGELYEVSSTGTAFLRIGTTATGNDVLGAVAASTRFFVAPASTVFLNLNSTTNGLTLDNVSLRKVVLTRGGAALGPNLAASGYTMKTPAVGTETMTESPAGQLNLTGDGTNAAYGDKSFTTVVGRKYRVMFTGAGSPGFMLVGTSQGGQQNVFAPTVVVGLNIFEFTATATTTWLRQGKGGAALWTITAIEVRELPVTGTYPKRAAAPEEIFAFTGPATTRLWVDTDGAWKDNLAANALRWDYRNGKWQLRLEDARTNSVRNNSDMSGVVAGTPGTMPPIGGWAWQPAAGVVQTIYGSGVENGLPYIEVGLSGTVGGANVFPAIVMGPSGLSAVPTTTSTIRAISAYFKLISGSFNGISVARITTNEFNAAGAYVQTGNGASITGIDGTIRRLSDASLPVNVNAAFIQPVIAFTALANQTLDLRFRVYVPQMEVGAAFASDPIFTTAGPVTRAIETARFSPLVEAIMQRASGGVVYRGKEDAQTTTGRRIVGGATAVELLGVAANSVTTLELYNGTNTLSPAFGSGDSISPFGAAMGFDSSGRSASANGGIGSDANPVGDRAAVYLHKSGSIGTTHGLVDFIGGAPERPSNAQLQALAVAA